jgi:hypothetical protein
MVQMADVRAYALHRYLENNDELLFNYVFQRADRKNNAAVGVRLFTNPRCTCRICAAHRKVVS